MNPTNPFNLTVIDDFLLPHECAYFIDQKKLELIPSSVCSEADGSPVLDNCRTSYGSFFKDNNDLVVDYLRKKLSVLTRVNPAHFEPVSILRYDVGQEYKPHFDYFRDHHSMQIGQAGQRIKTALLYLNDVQLGGETYFPHLSLLVKPSIGRLVLWDNMTDGAVNPLTRHGSLPVIEGEKYVLTVWIRERAF